MLSLQLNTRSLRPILSKPWSPVDIPNVNTWFDNDPDFMVIDGSNQITSWRDKVPFSNKVYTQPNPLRAPIWIGARKSLDFNGTKFMTRAINLTGVTNITYFYVFKYTGADNVLTQQVINGHNGVGGQITMNLKPFSGLKKTSVQLQAGGTTLTTAEINYSAISGNYLLYMVNYIAGGTSKIVVFDIGSPNVIATGNAGSRTFSANPMFMSCTYLETLFLTAEWKAMISVLGTPTDETINKILAYCRDRYGAAK